MKTYLLEVDNMTEKIKNWVNICVLKNQEILLLNRQHDNLALLIQLVMRDLSSMTFYVLSLLVN